jgi:Uma2 family endonuclease
MAIETRITEAEYKQFVLTHPDHEWELHEGQLREKPGVTFEHGDLIMELGYLLRHQLDRQQFRVAINTWRVRRPPSTIYIPDLVVVPVAYTREFVGRPGKLAIFSEPVPLVVEVWSTSTGNYDIDAKLPVYQQRGDQEIWYIHLYDRILTAWVRQPTGSYAEATYREGDIVRSRGLPGVASDLGDLFER